MSARTRLADLRRFRQRLWCPWFTPERIDETIRALHEAQESEVGPGSDDIPEQIKNCDAKLDCCYRAALDAGAELGVVATWIAHVQSERPLWNAGGSLSSVESE